MTDPTEKVANAKEVNSFITLREILLEHDDITITELDKAIEEHGIYTKWRNGRYKKHDYHSEQGERALNLLSYFNDYKLENETSWSIFTEAFISPLDNFTGKSKPADYDLYGWLKDDLPVPLSRSRDINRIKEKAVANKESNHSTFSGESTHDPLPTDGIARMFPVSPDQNENLKHWSGFAKNAPRNKLDHARTTVGKGRAQSKFDPVKVGAWLVEKGKMDQAKVDRYLANNYPPRNAHLKELST